jgi:hypothetical protein
MVALVPRSNYTSRPLRFATRNVLQDTDIRPISSITEEIVHGKKPLFSEQPQTKSTWGIL